MRNRFFIVIFATFVTLCSALPCRAQLLEAPNQTYLTDSLRQAFNKGPYFQLFKDNYFVVGTSVGHKPTADNSDVKFQISFAQRLTRATLPWNTFIFLSYSQKVMWSVFKNSMPMRDLNFNPAIGITKPLYSKDRYIGKASLMLEHESNGRDSIQSRSWNKVSLSANIFVTDWMMVHGKAWIPIVDGQNNRDIVKYCGWWQVGTELCTRDRRFIWGLTLVKRGEWKPSFNMIFDFSWRMFKGANQYFFLQFYNGYGENLLDYNQFHRSLRLGIVIKPRFFSEF